MPDVDIVCPRCQTPLIQVDPATGETVQRPASLSAGQVILCICCGSWLAYHEDGQFQEAVFKEGDLDPEVKAVMEEWERRAAEMRRQTFN